MAEYNSFINPNIHISSFRETSQKSPLKSLSYTNEEYLQQQHFSHRIEDKDHNFKSITLLNDIINKEKTNCSSINLSLRKKQIQIGEKIIQEQNRNHSLRHSSEKSPNKQLIKTPSSSCLSYSNNKHETSYIKSSYVDIQTKISKLQLQKKNAEESIGILMNNLQSLKVTKNNIQSQIENKISQKESYEEIYRYNISKYSQLNNNHSNKGKKSYNNAIGAQNEMMFTCGNVDNVIILKEEIAILTIEQYKIIIIMILTDLFNGNRDKLYHNLIEALAVEFYNDINNTNLGMIDTLILKLSKGICDLYPMMNEEILHLLFKYSIKQQYLEKIIEKEMHFITKEYKSKKRNDKAKVIELKDYISKCETQLIEANNKERDLIKQLEGINNDESFIKQVGIPLFKKDYCPEKKKLFEYEYEDQEQINQHQSFGRKLNDVDSDEKDGYCYNNSNMKKFDNDNDNDNDNENNECNDVLSNLLFEKKKVEKQIEDNLLISNKKISEYNNKIEEINGVNNIYMKHLINNNNNNSNNNETKSTFHRSASNTGNTFMKNEGSCSWIIYDNINNKVNPSQITKLKSNGFINEKHQQINQNDLSTYSYRNKSNNINSKSETKYAQPKRALLHIRQFLPLKNNNNTNNNISIISNSCKADQKDSGQVKQYPSLSDTYCYYKYLSSKDKKYNPLLSHYSPEKLGYEKGFIIYDSIKKIITITGPNNMKNVQIIPLSTVKNTAILNHSKDIYHIHRSYKKFLQRSDNSNININQFVKRDEFNNIKLNDDDKIKAALCSFFSFSLVLISHDIIELIFVSYHEFKIWLNGLSSLLKSTSY